MTLIIAACDKPEAKPPTNIEKDEKADTDTDAKGESGDEGEDATPAHSFTFDTASHKMAFTKGGTYTQVVVETNKPTGDARAITYTSSAPAIATVDNKGVVTFVTQGTVTITATKEAESGHPEATASYTMYITMKPVDREALIAEIDRAMKAHGHAVDLNYIDTSAITVMAFLFTNDLIHSNGLSAFNGDISKWDVSKVTTVYAMFQGATAFNQNISDWKVSQVTNMSSMFRGATAFNQNISDWKVSQVTNMSSMFRGATAFNQDISDWNVSQVTNMSSMFQGATTFNQNISDWNVSQVTNMSSMFQGATAFNQNISDWTVSNVTNMQSMFEGATAFDQDISGWEVGRVTYMISMFQGANSFKQNLDAWSTRINSAVKQRGWLNANNMFKGSGLASSLPSWCENVQWCRNGQ